MDGTNGSDASPSVAVEDVREGIERMGVKSAGSAKVGSGPEGAAGAAGAKEDKADVVSEEVCQSIKKGMKIVSDVEQTRADGTCFKFEVDLMYAVSEQERVEACGVCRMCGRPLAVGSSSTRLL